MSVTHAASVRQAVADFIVDLIDAGAGPGTLEFQTAGSVQVATCTFNDPAFGPANGSGIATANAITSDTNSTGGTIAKAVLKDSTGATVMTCSVTATSGGGDIEIDNPVVGPGDTVAVSSLTYEAMP